MSRRRNKKRSQSVVEVPRRALALDGARDYLVYWRNGLKSRCNGFRLSQALDFYLVRVRLILDAQTREQIYAGE